MQPQLPPPVALAEAPELIARLQNQLRTLPNLINAGLHHELVQLEALLRDEGVPRVMLLGRRGAGKSSLVNALVGRNDRPIGSVQAQTGSAVWTQIGIGADRYELLDTRGLQEGSRPVEADVAVSVEESLRAAVAVRSPDLILFLVKAKEVDAAINGDIDALERLHGFIAKSHGRAVPILGVLSQCDELEPADIKRLPTDDEEKRANINTATVVLVEHLLARPALASQIIRSPIPTAAVAVFDGAGQIIPERDYRWNIDLLAAALSTGTLHSVSFSGRLEAIQVQRRKAAETLVRIATTAAAGVALPPVPALDLLPIMQLRELMIIGVGRIAGYDLSRDDARVILQAIDPQLAKIPLAGGDVLRTAVRLIPGFGMGAGALIGGQQMKLTGKAVLSCLLDQNPLTSLRTLAVKRFASGRTKKP